MEINTFKVYSPYDVDTLSNGFFVGEFEFAGLPRAGDDIELLDRVVTVKKIQWVETDDGFRDPTIVLEPDISGNLKKAVEEARK